MNVPEDIEYLAPFFPAIRHIRSVTKLSSGLCVVTLKILVDEYGRPYPGLWMMPTLEKLVPKDTADLALREIIDKLTNT
jgi:hypothetical protein